MSDDQAIPSSSQEIPPSSEEFPSFSELFVELTQFLGRVPVPDRTLLNDKALNVISNKFTHLLNKEQVAIDDVTREIIGTVSKILAICIEDVLLEMRDGTGAVTSEAGSSHDVMMTQKPSDVYEVMATEGSDYLIQNVGRRREELKGLFDWMGTAMTTADEWSAWIQETVASAEEKVHKQMGEVVNEEGEVEKLTSGEWREWKENLKQAARGMLEKRRGLLEAAGKLGHVEPPVGE